jgi:hypothetical protein
MTTGNGDNGISKKKQETCARIIQAIKESQGLLTLAAKKAGISFTTINRYVNEFPSVKQATHEAREVMLDFAESKLWEKMKAGDNTAIIFFLKCQGKSRGYVERQEVTGAEGQPIKVEHTVLIKKLETLAGVKVD